MAKPGQYGCASVTAYLATDGHRCTRRAGAVTKRNLGITAETQSRREEKTQSKPESAEGAEIAEGGAPIGNRGGLPRFSWLVVWITPHRMLIRVRPCASGAMTHLAFFRVCGSPVNRAYRSLAFSAPSALSAFSGFDFVPLRLSVSAVNLYG